jgi:hypothetical protein
VHKGAHTFGTGAAEVGVATVLVRERFEGVATGSFALTALSDLRLKAIVAVRDLDNEARAV